MAKGWPNSFITYPFSGILSGYVIHPYHMSDLYDELSGVEFKLGLMPIVRNAQTSQVFNSFTERVSGIETGYARGPHGATDGRIALFDSTTGKLLKQANLGISSNVITSSDSIGSINIGSFGNNLQITSITENIELTTPDGSVIVNSPGSGVILTTYGVSGEFIAPGTDDQGTLGKSSKHWNSIYVNNIYKYGLLWEPLIEIPIGLMTGYNAPMRSGVIPVYQGNGYNELGPSSLRILENFGTPAITGTSIDLVAHAGTINVHAATIAVQQVSSPGGVAIGGDNQLYSTQDGATNISGVGLLLRSINNMRIASQSGIILIGSPGDPFQDWGEFTPTSLVPITSGSGHIGMYYSYWGSGYFKSTVTNKLILNGIEYTTLAGGGDVVGPASATDNAIARFDTGTGKLIQNSSVTIGDGGHVLPSTSGTHNLGAPTLRWNGVHADSVYSKQYVTQYISGAGGNKTIDWNNGVSQHLNFNGIASGVYSINFANGIAGSAYILTTQQNGSGNISLAWGSNSVIWQGGVSGVMTASGNSIDMFSFYYNGSNYLGSYSNNYF